MALVETLSDVVQATLRASRNGSGNDPLAIAVTGDIGRDGSLGERWLVVDKTTIRVISLAGDGSAIVDRVVPLAEVTKATTENLVGGGALVVLQGSDTIELLRYTTGLQGRMASVARAITALATGDEPSQTDQDEEKRECPTCGRPLPEDNDVCRFCVNKSAVLVRLFSYASNYRWHAVWLVALMFGGTALSLAPGIIIKEMTDRVLVPRGSDALLPISSRFTLLGVLIGALVGSQLLGVGLTIVRGRLSAWLSQIITYNIRTELFDHLQWLGLSYYDKRQTGSLIARVTQDVNELNNFLVDGLQILVVNGLTLIGILVVLLRYNWQLTLIVLFPIPFVVYLTRLVWKALRRRMQRMWHLRSILTANLSSVLSGARVVKAFAQEEREIDRFHNRSTEMMDVQLSVEQGWATLMPILNYLTTAGSFIVWYIGGRQVVGGIVTLGVLQMFLFFLGQLYGPLQQMTRIADWLSRALTSGERVFEILDTEADVADVADAVAIPHIFGEVRFENVSFGYDKSRRVLENVSLTIAPGEMLGLVGHSGAGKTTIINLIARFYDPSEGRILIDGVDMKRVRLHDLRQQMGIVLQEPFLFPGTIAENIAYAKPEASPEEVMRAAKAANAHDFIMRFPDGYDTEVGERGVKLSGGERQRLSIARAVLHNPRILILDEATASVDTETEKQIQEAISRLIAGRTTFAIAHRLSTLRNADRLLVMEKGKIAELGTHDELMAKPEGTFRRLVEMQTEINKLRVYDG